MTHQSLGVCYYPEHWPETYWRDDAEKMALLGIKFVRIGEFAWSRLEPAPDNMILIGWRAPLTSCLRQD